MRRKARSTTDRWQLQDAKKRLLEVVRKAREEGPQVITLCGDDAVVVEAADKYQKLSRKPKGNLVDFFHRSPLAGVELDVKRSRDTSRQVDL